MRCRLRGLTPPPARLDPEQIARVEKECAGDAEQEVEPGQQRPTEIAEVQRGDDAGGGRRRRPLAGSVRCGDGEILVAQRHRHAIGEPAIDDTMNFGDAFGIAAGVMLQHERGHAG